MSSTEVARIERPPEKFWRYRVANSYNTLLKIGTGLAVVTGTLTIYFLVIKKKQMFDAFEKKHYSEEEMQKKFDNMVKLKCFRCKQLDKYEWD